MATSLLPNAPLAAKAWHGSPLASSLIADMHTLAAMADTYLNITRGRDGRYCADDTAEAIGSLERRGSPFRLAATTSVWEGSGLIGEMLVRLTGERDDWIEAEHVRCLRAAGLQIDSDAAEDIYHDIVSTVDTVTTAIDAWVAGQQQIAA